MSTTRISKPVCRDVRDMFEHTPIWRWNGKRTSRRGCEGVIWSIEGYLHSVLIHMQADSGQSVDFGHISRQHKNHSNFLQFSFIIYAAWYSGSRAGIISDFR